MAISFIDSNIQDSSGAQALTFAIPAGATTDDLILVFVKQSENTGQQIWDDDGGGGRGYTRLAYNRFTSGRDQETAIYYKMHSGSETNPTFTWDSGGVNEPMSGSMLIYRGIDTLVPIANYGYSVNQNDANPPNPSVVIETNNSWVVCCHAATHDDITAVAAPTGFTLRTQVWNGTADDHRNHFTADISGLNPQTYSPPDWQHTASATTPEYQTYSIALNEVQAISVSTYPAAFNWGDTGLVATGLGFEATQNTGKLEMWSDASGTIKVAQTITSWSDSSITFTATQGGLANNVAVYLAITNHNGDVTPVRQSNVGLVNYQAAVNAINPDHFWSFDGTYVDTGVGGAQRDATQSVVGTHPWVTAIADDATQAMQFDDILDRRECPDSPYMNVTIDAAERTVAGWIQLGDVQKSMGAIWKEGGGVQNLALISGLGNVLMAQAADSPGNAINAQAVAEIKLTPNRPYHFAMRYTLTESPKELRLYLDGIEQPYALTNGNPFGAGTFNSHSGDVTWGNSDNNLETGGTDISYAGQVDCKYQHWCSWSDNSPNSGALNKTTEILEVLFKRGALPKYTLALDTEANVQTALDALGTLEVEDYPLGIRVAGVTGQSNMTLTATNLTFNSRTSMQVEWRGSGVLTWVVSSGSELDDTKLYASNGGSIVVERPATFTVANLLAGSIVEIYDDEIANVGSHDTKLAYTNNSGTSFQYSHNGASNDIILQVIKDGYKEIKIPFTLGSSDQIQNIVYIEDTND